MVVKGHVEPAWPWPLTLGLPEQNVSNGTSAHDGEQLYKFILKSIETCRSYGPDRPWPYMNQYLKLHVLWNPFTIVEFMVQMNLDAHMHPSMQYTELLWQLCQAQHKQAWQKLKCAYGRVENIVGKREKAGNRHFLLFPQCLQKASYTRLYWSCSSKLL